MKCGNCGEIIEGGICQMVDHHKNECKSPPIKTDQEFDISDLDEVAEYYKATEDAHKELQNLGLTNAEIENKMIDKLKNK